MKLKLLTVLFLIIYILSFTSHFKDFARGFSDGNSAAINGTEIYNLRIEQINKIDSIKILAPNVNTTITKDFATEKIRIETKDDIPNYFKVPRGILMIAFTLLIPAMFIILYIFFTNLYKGDIVSKRQIKNLTFLGYAHLSYALVENFLILTDNLHNQKVAIFYNLSFVKDEYDITLFFIPLILLMIVEVLKQHLRLKEDAELII
ncbi:DUF2975 domain-containing protein [Myroides odoratimimus]|uniref:DUF2975 domain-containing protein n=1 Tax=Myroides odoratimimus TaxID=76832 RepID=UPI002DBE333A|nr:DUF2975 domain-containing protein [Myroides odoratimimus]MEC4051261.1 DUF2975 domain-containing protein [Myroides odoratimimus]